MDAYNGSVFVSPPVNGWVFVVSSKLPELGGESDTNGWTTLLSGLAHKFDDVQYFGTHRVVEYHAWARFTSGKEIGAFAFLGERAETLADRGEKTVGERELGYKYLAADAPNTMSDSYWEQEDAGLAG